jgi:Zn-dependent protease with chaperone function
MLFALRLLPVALGAFVALGLCVPSFLIFEPESFDEPVRIACLLPALAGFAICGQTMIRLVRACRRSFEFGRRYRDAGQEAMVAGQQVWIVESSAPCLALTGILHPRVVISRRLAEALSGEELTAVLSHEAAHRSSFDNLKRLCLILAPGPQLLERAWGSMAEYAADRAAVEGDSRLALALASALVKVARLGPHPTPSPLATSLLADEAELTLRVSRLLADPDEDAKSGGSEVATVALGVAMLVLAGAACQPAPLRFVHSLLEGLMQ